MSDYLDPDSIDAARTTDVPWKGRTASGYGGAVPTQYLVRITDSPDTPAHWHRVRVMLYGNSGSSYVTVRGVDYFLGTDAEYRIRTLADAS